MASDVEKLAAFFRSGAITIENKVREFTREIVFRDGTKYYVPYEGEFTDDVPLFGSQSNEEFEGVMGLCMRSFQDDVDTVRKGLRYVGRLNFRDFSITTSNSTGPKFKLISADSASHEVEGVLGYIKDLSKEDTLLELGSKKGDAGQEVKDWVRTGTVPDSLVDLIGNSESVENKKRIYVMLGRQTYKHRRNKNFGDELKRLMNLYSSQVSSPRKERKHFFDNLTKGQIKRVLKEVADVNLGNLVNRRLEANPRVIESNRIVRVEQSKIDEEVTDPSEIFRKKGEVNTRGFHLVDREREKYLAQVKSQAHDAIEAIAEVASGMRKRYKKQGIGVPISHGFVRREDYGVLFKKSVSEFGSNSLITAGILSSSLGGTFSFVSEDEFFVDYLTASAAKWRIDDKDLPKDYSEAPIMESPREKPWGYSCGVSMWETSEGKEVYGVDVLFPSYFYFDNNAFGEVTHANFRYYLGGVFDLPNLEKLGLEHFEVIGNYRFSEFLEGHGRPYSKERPLITGLIARHKARRNFQGGVDLWLENQGESGINWREIDNAIDERRRMVSPRRRDNSLPLF